MGLLMPAMLADVPKTVLWMACVPITLRSSCCMTCQVNDQRLVEAWLETLQAALWYVREMRSRCWSSIWNAKRVHGIL